MVSMHAGLQWQEPGCSVLQLRMIALHHLLCICGIDALPPAQPLTASPLPLSLPHADVIFLHMQASGVSAAVAKQCGCRRSHT